MHQYCSRRLAVPGFTLLEVLIALSLFAVLAVITSSSMYHAFDTRARVNKKADQLNSLELAISLIKQDTAQIIERPVRGDNFSLSPAFLGNNHHVEFTRSGMANPNGLEQRSTQQRVAWLCSSHRLIRRTWPMLDTPHREKFQDRVLLTHLKRCQFGFLDAGLHVLQKWRGGDLTESTAIELFPKAIQLNLTLPDWGKGTLLFLIPAAVYNNV